MKKYKIGTMFYDGELHYHIENEKGNLIIGRLTYKEAHYYIDNPGVLKSTVRKYNVVMVCVVVFILLSILFVAI